MQHRVWWQLKNCAHAVAYIPVHAIHPPFPSHIHFSIPPFGTLTAPDGQVGRRRQVPVANSPSPVALLLLCGEKGDGNHGSRYPKPLWNNSSSSAAPHLSLPSTDPARRRSITVYRARPKRPFNYKTFFFPWRDRVRSLNALGVTYVAFCDPQYVFPPGRLVQTVKSQILQLRTVLSLLSGAPAACLHSARLRLWNQ